MNYPTGFFNRRAMALLIVFAVLLHAGCGTTPPKTRFYATQRSLSMESDPPKMQGFGPGEIPSLKIEGYDGQTVTVAILDMLTGKTVETRTSYIPKGRNNVMPFELSPGSYQAELYVSGTIVSTWKFKVAGTE